MEQIFNSLIAFLETPSIWMYLFIFFGKILEVAVSTLRSMLINRGERLKGVIAAIIEYALWIFITASALTNIQSDPLKIFVLIVAFAAGNFFGSWLEERLAFGLTTIFIIMKDNRDARALASHLRENGHAVTVLDGEGTFGMKREMLMLTTRRKFTKSILALIHAQDEDAMVTISNASSFKGGFLKKLPKHRFFLK